MLSFHANAIVCIQYCVISVICTFLLIYCIVVTNRSAEHSSELFFYKLTMAFTALCSFSDVAFALREFGMVPLGNTINYISEIIYSLGSICGAYSWFIYSEKKQRTRISFSPVLTKLCAVPFIVMSLFVLTTPLHKLCFSLSGSQYIRGILNIPFTAVCIAFIMFSGINAVINSFRKQYHSSSVLLRLLFLYTFFIVAAQMIQVAVGSILPFRSLSATVIFLFVTLRGMCETVTVDALSHINNRFSLNRVLDDKILGNEKFWLLMLDIDDFKHINDTFGHVHGDEAICHTASAIVRAVPHNYFVARFGGDEFAIVAPFEAEPLIGSLEGKIRIELQKIVRENDCPFSIDITAGYAPRNESINNIPDMIAAADKICYERKHLKKTQTSAKKM